MQIDTKSIQISELSKVRTFERQQWCYNILHESEACHTDRLDLVRFLGSKRVGYSFAEVLDIIHAENIWGDYDPFKTWNQVKSVFEWLYRQDSRSRAVRHISNGFEESLRGTFSKVPFIVRAKSPCALNYIPCSSCSFLVKGKGCTWVTK